MKNNKIKRMIAIGSAVLCLGSTTAFAGEGLISDLSKNITFGESVNGIAYTDLVIDGSANLSETECINLSGDITIKKPKEDNVKIYADINMEMSDGVVLSDNQIIDIPKNTTIRKAVAGTVVDTDLVMGDSIDINNTEFINLSDDVTIKGTVDGDSVNCFVINK